MALISLRAYARHRDVTLRAVQKAIEAKRISLINGKIDPDVADIQWAKNTRPDQQEKGSLKDFEKTQQDLMEFDAVGVESPAASTNQPERAVGNLAVEKAGTENIRRQLMELQLAQRNGELVKAADIERAMAAKVRAASELLNNMAYDLAPKLAAETDINKIEQILQAEIRKAMALTSKEAPNGLN